MTTETGAIRRGCGLVALGAAPLLLASCASEPAPPPPALNPPTYLAWVDLIAPVRVRSAALQVVDVDGDGQEEILAPDLTEDLLSVFHLVPAADGRHRMRTREGTPFARPDGARRPGVDLNAPLFVADLDGDGRRDVVVRTLGADPSHSRVVIRWNLGGTFSAPQVVHRSVGSELREIVAVPVRGAGGLRSVIVLGSKGPDSTSEEDARAFSVAPSMVDALPFFDPGTPPGEPPRIIEVFADRRTARREIALPDCMAQGAAVADFDRDGNQEVLLACDFGPQLALRVRADGAVEHLPDFFPPHPGLAGRRLSGHGMGVAVADVDGDGYPDAAVSTIGGFFDLRGGASGMRLASTGLSRRARAYWPWGVAYADLRNDGRQVLLSSAEFGRREPFADASSYAGEGYGPHGDYRDSYLAFVAPDSANEYRVQYTAFTDAGGVAVFGTTKVAALDADNDGVLEVAMVLVRSTPGEGDFGELHVGRPAWPTPPGHGLTLHFAAGGGPPITRARLRCRGGEEREDRLFLAEGASGGRRHFLHLGCGAADSYDWLRLFDDAGRTLEMPGGPLRRALLCDADGGTCRELPRGSAAPGSGGS